MSKKQHNQATEVPASSEGATATATAEPEEVGGYSLGEPAPPAVLDDIRPNVVTRVDPTFLSVERGWNVRDFSSRETREHLDNLTALIASAGEVHEPIRFVVRDGRLVVRQGETRLRAVLAVREKQGNDAIPTVPALPIEEYSDPIREEIEQDTRNSGKPFSMLEKYTLVRRLSSHGLTTKGIQEALNLSHTAIGNLSILGKVSEDVRQAIRDGWLSASFVIREGLGKKAEEFDALNAALMKVANNAKNENQQAAKGRKSPTINAGRTVDTVLFNRATFNTLISNVQDALALLPADPGTDETMGKVVNLLRSGLENAGAPLENPREKLEAQRLAEAKAKAEADAEKARKRAEEQAAKAKAKAEEAAAKALAKAEEAAAKAKALANGQAVGASA